MSGSTVDQDSITWINHAGYQLQTGEVRLACDPWLTGPAFDHGWDLLVPSRFSSADLGAVTHIWFSHEHPDHFSPADIRNVEPDRRKKITVLYQRTRDRRVVAYCEKLGFAVQELDPGVPFEIGSGVRGVIGVVSADSWLHIETPSRTYLNLNDCILERPEHYAAIRRVLKRPLDVLLAQFSYANWAGNRGDYDRMRLESREKIEQIRRNLAQTKPRFFIPFASFVFFSNEENFYLNEGANSIGSIFHMFDMPQRPCIVLYPGDVWAPDRPHDSADRIERYVTAREAIAPRYASRPVSSEELQDLAIDCARRVARSNNLWAIRAAEWAGLLPPLTVRLEDLNLTVTYRPGRPLTTAPELVPDISCTAEAFAQCLRFDFGADTLLVNGRFQVCRPDGRARLSRAFGINRHNSRGFGFPWGMLRARFPSADRILRYGGEAAARESG